MKFILAVVSIIAATLAPAHADEKKPSPQEIEAFKRVMKTIGELQFQSGNISLAGGKVKLSLPPEFHYLDPTNARKVLVDIYGNPSEAGNTAGMIVPKGINFISGAWTAVLQWKEEGYVRDSDFEKIDFNEMLDELKKAYKVSSEERVRAGYGKMELAAWAQQPHYDRAKHKLYYAKSFNVNGPEQQLNYDIRILGRHGFLEISIMSSMSQLHDIEAKVPTILGIVDFTDGNSYGDFKPGDGRIAGYGLAGLIGGKAFETDAGAEKKEGESKAGNIPFVTARSENFESHFPVTAGLVFLGLCLVISAFVYSSRFKSMPNNEKSPQPSGIAQNMPTFIAALGMCGGFFMPWVTLGGRIGITGSTFAKLGEEGQVSWLILIVAAVAAITHMAKPVKILNVLAGITPFGLLGYFVSKMGDKMGSKLLENLGIGAWLTLGCGLVLILAPVKSASKD